MNNRLPECIKTCLWSYDTTNLDIKKYKDTIITQVLNYGDWNAVKWLFKTYKPSDIKKSIRKPQRGMWFKDTINFWLIVFNIKIPPSIKQKSIFNLDPATR
jgi:hypothetical protein